MSGMYFYSLAKKTFLVKSNFYFKDLKIYDDALVDNGVKISYLKVDMVD